MPPVERDAPILRHTPSASSDNGRALVPMWDSSDPERAPPPLPLNPQSPSVSPSRAGTSMAIQSAHAALTEKARESALVPSLAKRMTETSPERAVVHRPSPHKRMQSLQPTRVTDRSLMIEASPRHDSSIVSAGSMAKSPEKYSFPETPGLNKENERAKSVDREDGAASPTPSALTLTPVVRPSMRRVPQSILSENTPPQSATMLALQSMSSTASREPRPSEAPLANVTNQSRAVVTSPVRETDNNPSGQTIQLADIMNMCKGLHEEIGKLSRRSRDNATDLASLRSFNHDRTEGIQKTLRQLMEQRHSLSSGGSLFLDDRPHDSPPAPRDSKVIRPVSLPRIPSLNSFAASIDRETNVSTPSLVGSDSPTSIALLEKIIRDMGTKEGQDAVLGRLIDLADKLCGLSSSQKVEELIELLKASQDTSVVPAGGNGGRPRNFSFEEADDGALREIDWNHNQLGPMTQRVNALINDKESRRSSAPPSRQPEILNDDVVKAIRMVKDSVAQGGGLTAEVKALVRELRGEVLGMGREIGRRLDETQAQASSHNEAATKTQIESIVGEGLDQMRQHLNELLREHRRSSAASVKSAVDYQEIYRAMTAALSESQVNRGPESDVSREDVIQAVRDAWETYKPDIQIENIGLERDEVLACLKEGLQDYAQHGGPTEAATREEVFQAVVEGLKHFKPPRVDTPESLSRDEILDAVRECLEEFQFPNPTPAQNNELSREDVLDAVQQGLENFDFPATRALNVPNGNLDDNVVIDRLHDIMQFMKDEFSAVSLEAKQNVAAHGRDTEQVLDATKDGFDQLRQQMENYIDRVSSDAGNEERLETLANSLGVFRDDLSEIVARASEESRTMLKEEIESMRDAVNSSLVPHQPQSGDSRELLESLRDGLERVRQDLLRPFAGTTDILDALHEGFVDLRDSMKRMGDKPVDLTANDEILDALKEGLNDVKSDIGTLRDHSNNDKAVAPVGTGTASSDAMIPGDLVKQDDIKNLEVMLTQLRIKVESIDPTPPATSTEALSKDDLSTMEDMLRNVQESVAGLSSKDAEATSSHVNPEDAASKEDVQAIENILRNTKARLDDLVDGEQAVRKEHVDAIETLVLETKDNLGLFSAQLETMSKKEDIVAVESLVSRINIALDEMKERSEKSFEDPEKVTKTDVDAVEAAVLDMKTVLETMTKSDLASLPQKDDLKVLEDTIKDAKIIIEAHVETTAKAFEERQAETVGVSEGVNEVKAFLEEFQILLKGKLEHETSGLEALSNTLDALGETVSQQADVPQTVKDMFELMKTEFEESKAGLVGAKLDTDEKMQATTEALTTKIDERIGELVAKYEEFQLAMEERVKAGETRDAELESAVTGTKAIADELKLLIDTLGSTVTDSVEKSELASRTVFDRVEEMLTKSEANHSDDKNEHSMTRDKVSAAVTVVEGLQGYVVEQDTKILEALKDVLLMVGQHYEHSKTTSTDLQQKIEDVKDKEPEPPLLPPAEKYDDTEVLERLNKLVEQKYDDTEMHTKLDRLVSHSEVADKAYAQLDTLEKVHVQVVQTAADISSFLDAQTKQIEANAEEHQRAMEDARSKLEQTNISLAVAQAEKEHVEANVESLRSEEEQLRESILALRAEQEETRRQKARLSADVSSLEMAMHIRREELHHMEKRAGEIERRVVEGMLDHSRALFATKPNGANKGRDAMSRKRVPAARSSLAPADIPSLNVESTPTKSTPHRKAVNIAVSGSRGSLLPTSQSNTPRRILSLSQITNNTPTGGMKRSQSVRTATGAHGALRKSSWGGGLSRRFGEDADKENGGGDANDPMDEVRELDEPESEIGDRALVIVGPESLAEDDFQEEAVESIREDGEGDDLSDSGTLRRSSMGTTVITSTETEDGTEGDYYSQDEDGEGREEDEADDGERSYASGSYDDATEYTNSVVGTETESALGRGLAESLADTDSVVESLVDSAVDGQEGGEMVMAT